VNGQAGRALRESYFPRKRWSITRGVSCFQTHADQPSPQFDLLTCYTILNPRWFNFGLQFSRLPGAKAVELPGG
jgi:hypothetical protein